MSHYVIVCYFFPKPYLFFFAQNKNQNIFWHKKSVRLKWSVLIIMVHLGTKYMSSFPLVVSPEIITLVLEKNEVLSVFSIIIICKQLLNTFTVCEIVEDRPMNIHVQFGFNHICSFWEEGILNTTLCDSMLFFPQAIFIFFCTKQKSNTFTVWYDTLEIWSGEKYYIFVT
jgi:hypothetical protein